MSLNAINSYVNDIVSANRSGDPENITTYFRLMSERAAEMLNHLQASARLIGLEQLDASLLNTAEKFVVLEAVNYIIAHSLDLGKGLSIINGSGLLNLNEQPPENRYVLVYKLEPVLKYASELYADNLGWWDAFKQRNKAPNHFSRKFEEAATSEKKVDEESQVKEK